MSSSNCCFLTYTQNSQEAGEVVCYSHLLKNFPQFAVIHAVKGFSVVSQVEVDVQLFSCLASLKIFSPEFRIVKGSRELWEYYCSPRSCCWMLEEIFLWSSQRAAGRALWKCDGMPKTWTPCVMPSVRVPKTERIRRPQWCKSMKGFIASSSQGSCHIQHSGVEQEPGALDHSPFYRFRTETESWQGLIGCRSFLVFTNWLDFWRRGLS